MKLNLKLLIEILIGIIIITFMLNQINLTEVISLLSKADLALIFLAIIIYIATFWLTAWGLKELFASKIDLKWIEWLKYYWINFSLSMILPGRTGDFSIIYFFKKKNISIGTSTALVIIDKIITLILFGLVSLLGLFTLIESNELYLGLLATLLILALSIFIFSRSGRRILYKILGKHSVKLADFHESYDSLLKSHKDKLLINFVVTILRPILNGLLIVILFKALNYDVSLFYSIVISSITLIASLVPLTPNGVGIREGLGLLLFNRLGIPFEASLSMYLIILIMNYFTGIVGVLYYFTTKEPKDETA